MLQQKNRFHGHGSLRYVYRNGQATRSSMITIKYISNPHRKNSRFSVVISKKVIKLAVKRNRLRRRIYEIIRTELPKLKTNHDVVIMIFSPEVYSFDSDKLNQVLKASLSQSGLYK